MDTNKLKGRIVEVCGSQKALAQRLGVTEQTVINKLSGRTQFSIEDIVEWCSALDIKKDEVPSYFFADSLKDS